MTDITAYHRFLESKQFKVQPAGFEPTQEINPVLFDFQRDIVAWALRKGKAAIFAGTGLGKTLMQLEWALHVHRHTGGNVLILAPLAVSQQTVREGAKIGIEVNICRKQEDVGTGINTTNYEMLPHFDASQFIAVVLDESSILKSFSGKTRTEIIKKFKDTKYKLACTATQEIIRQNIKNTVHETEQYQEQIEVDEGWSMVLGDNVEKIRMVMENSIHYILFSPPFSQLFVYSNSLRDMGNCRNDEEFFEHMGFLSKELLRILKPGRLMSVHCTQIPTAKSREGYVSLKDFRGDLIRLFQGAGFILHSEVVVWKDPVQEMYRTKSIGLLHKQLKKDSAMSRQGRADYILTFQKPGTNIEPITHTDRSFPVPAWQKYASQVWMDIDQMDVLNGSRNACDNEDEKHICPLQLEAIKRCLELWTNPGDTVVDPFAGIGSTGYEAVKAGRKFLGFELKRSYFEQAVKNLRVAQREASKPKQTGLSIYTAKEEQESATSEQEAP